MKNCSAIVLLALCAMPALARELPPDLAAAARAYDQAQFRNDTQTLSHLVADDFVLVNSDASVENKQQFLADFNLPGFRIDPYVMEESVSNAWGDAAVVGGLIHLRWTQDGKHQTRVVRVVYVWAKTDGQWRARYAQVTRVPGD